MTKELQDLAWALLPKEFKEEVKKMRQKYIECRNEYEANHRKDRANVMAKIICMNTIFGHHNLTSDAEGEEYLCIERNKVQKLYDELLSERNVVSISSPYGGTITARLYMLKDLFGSKCLPDENKECSNPSVVDCKHKHGDGSCSLDGMCCHKSPKPTEPKYHKDEKVRIKGVAGFDVIKSIHKTDKEGYRYELDGEIAIYDESELEPYTTAPKYHKNNKVLYKDKLKVVISERLPNGYYYIALPNGQNPTCKHESELRPFNPKYHKGDRVTVINELRHIFLHPMTIKEAFLSNNKIGYTVEENGFTFAQDNLMYYIN